MATLPCLKDKPQTCITPGRRCRWFDTQTCSCLLEDKKADYRDAAEFEARVASLLAQPEGAWQPCFYTHCPLGSVFSEEECIQCRIKYARIAVEQEMEQEALCLKS